MLLVGGSGFGRGLPRGLSLWAGVSSWDGGWGPRGERPKEGESTLPFPTCHQSGSAGEVLPSFRGKADSLYLGGRGFGRVESSRPGGIAGGPGTTVRAPVHTASPTSVWPELP